MANPPIATSGPARRAPGTRRSGRRRLVALFNVAVLSLAAVGAQLVITPASPAQAAPAANCELVAPPSPAFEHEGIETDYANRWKDPIGQQRVITLFVDFSNAVGTTADRVSLTNAFTPAVNWYNNSSYGRTTLDVQWTTSWYRMPQPSSFYHGNDPNGSVTGSFASHRTFMKDAVAAADPQVNFSNYDIVHVVVPTVLHGPNYRSAAYIALNGNTSDYLSTAEGPKRFGALVGWGSDQGHRIFVHETGHLFGLPDLYSYATGSLASIGGWDLMGATWANAPDHLAWHKWKLAWLDDTQLYCMDTHTQVTRTLTPLHTAGGLKMVVVRTGTNQVVVVEYRASGGPIDGVPGQVPLPGCFRPGVLMYTVDAGKVGGQEPINVVDANPGTTTGSGCDASLRALEDATLVTSGQSVTDPLSGVQVQLTGTSTVQVTWP
jgi:M6 family metalloprotease-like protein